MISLFIFIICTSFIMIIDWLIIIFILLLSYRGISLFLLYVIYFNILYYRMEYILYTLPILSWYLCKCHIIFFSPLITFL